MKRVVPVAVGLAAGMAAGFFLGAMVTRHDEPIVVIHNGTEETLPVVFFQADFHKSLRGIPASEAYSIHELQPHHTSAMRLVRPTGFKVDATTAGGKKLSSERVYVAAHDVVFALISSDGITLQSKRLISD